jgi:hypothetical protein
MAILSANSTPWLVDSSMILLTEIILLGYVPAQGSWMILAFW